MALNKEELLKALKIIKDLQNADADDKAKLAEAQAKAEAYKADHDLVNDPELVAAFDEVTANAAAAPSSPAPDQAADQTPDDSGATS